MKHPRHILVVSCLIRNVRGQILLVRHRQRGWELPQGRVEEGEPLLAALHREVREETGVEIEAIELAMVWSKLNPPAAKIFCFKAQYKTGEPSASEETPEVAWWSAADAVERISHPVNRDRFETLLAHVGSPQFRSYTTGPYRLDD